MHVFMVATAAILTVLGLLAVYRGIFRAPTDREAAACILVGVGCLCLLLFAAVANLG